MATCGVFGCKIRALDYFFIIFRASGLGFISVNQ